MPRDPDGTRGVGFGFLHSFRCGEAEQVDARLQNAAGQVDKRGVAGLPALVRLCEDLDIVIELVRGCRKLVDIRADGVRRGIAVGRPERVRHTAEHEHVRPKQAFRISPEWT